MFFKNIFTFVLMFFSLLTNLYSENMTKINAYQFSFNDVHGGYIPLSDFSGKVILIVNTASKCGFTPQYKELETLHQNFHDKGLIIIGVPSANFANQEFQDNKEIDKFTKEQFDINFLITEKCDVKGKAAHPFYQWANKEAGFLGSPKWNFHKYIIDKNGNFAAWYSSQTKPTSTKIINKIEELL